MAQGGGVICHGDERTTDPSFSDGPWGRESLRSSARRDREPRGDRAARWAGKGAARSPGSGLQGPFPFLQIGVSKLGAREAGRGHVAGRPRARMTMGGALCALRELQRGYLVLEVHLPSGAVRQEAVEPGRARRAGGPPQSRTSWLAGWLACPPQPPPPPPPGGALRRN